MENTVVQSRVMPLIGTVYQFLISLKLAVILILSLIVSLSAGTILESLYGAPTAKIIVYNSFWFSFILLMLGFNVLTVALSRFPWKKKHIGFLMTHLGIILILIGSMVTRCFMTDGQLIISEGDYRSVVKLPEASLRINRLGDTTAWSTSLPQKAFAWEGREKLGTPGKLPVSIYLKHYYPKAKAAQTFRPGHAGVGALHLCLESSMASQEMWLQEDLSGVRAVNLGPANVVFGRPIEAPEELKQKDLALEFRFGKEPVIIPLEQDSALPREINLEGTPYKIIIDALFKNAMVEDRKLVENPGALTEWGNPAVKLRLLGENIEEKHHVFAHFPDFATVHGREDQSAATKILFHAPGAEENSAQNELRFYKDENGLKYQIKSGTELSGGEVEINKETPLGWMDFKFRVDQYYAHAEEATEFEVRSNTSTADGVTTAIELAFNSNGEEAAIWMRLEDMRQVRVGENVYRIQFGMKEKDLGFGIKLIDFKKETYPGTNKPASFSSDVELIDAERGIRKKATISMNEPLAYRGYKVFQSAYHEQPGQPDVSIFSVGRDPGIPLNYVGAATLVSGIIVMILMQAVRRKKKGKALAV